MGKHVIRISEAEAAATSVATLLARVRAGAEIVIENDTRPVAILHATEPVRRTISECIALLPEDSTATIDPDFSRTLRPPSRAIAPLQILVCHTLAPTYNGLSHEELNSSH